MYHLEKTISTRESQRHATASPLPQWSHAKLVVVELVVVVDERKVIVLKLQRTSTPKQQMSPKMRTIDRKSQTCN
jgi:hypothetical protein